MKRYLLKRILFSLFSVFVVVGAVMILVYTSIDRELVFVGDAAISHKINNELEMYKIDKYQKYGYLTYENYSNSVANKYKKIYGDDYVNHEDYQNAVNAIKQPETYLENYDVNEFRTTYLQRGYTVKYLPPKYSGTTLVSNPYLVAYRDLSIFNRLFKYFGNMFKFETINDVKDEKLTNRYIRWEWDKRSNMPALVGSGTTHKYLIYFDNKFPFIHQNIFHLNLGKSYTTYRDMDLVEVFNQNTGEVYFTDQEWPSQIGTGVTHSSSYDYHTVTYNSGELQPIEMEMYSDRYTIALQQKNGISRMANSFIIGIIATVLVYVLGLPIGIWMATRKDKLPDKVGNLYIIFVSAIPTLAYIFMLASIGMTVFGLPYKFATAQTKILGYIMPILSLTLPSVAGLMRWMRRYMVDQMNSDYVKFARSQGLSEGETFAKHIAPNAFIYLVHDVPASVLGALTGAMLTEKVYGVPGVGGLLVNAINLHDNAVIVAMALFYTVLSIVAIILGDLLLAKYDPRITFAEGGN